MYLPALFKLTSFIVVITFSSMLSAKPRLWIEKDDSMQSQGTVNKDDNNTARIGVYQTADITKLVADNPQALDLAKLSAEYDTSGKIRY